VRNVYVVGVFGQNLTPVESDPIALDMLAKWD